MSYTNQTLNYGIPLPTDSDFVNGLDWNASSERIDSDLHQAVTTAEASASEIASIKSTVAQLQGADIEFQNHLNSTDANVSANTTAINGILDNLTDAEDMICAFEEPTATSTHAYAVGDYFRYNNVLYKATDVIGISDTIVPNVNCSATNVTTELLVEVTPDASDIDYDNTTSGLSAINVQGAIDEVNQNLTDLGDVETLYEGNSTTAYNTTGSTLTLTDNLSKYRYIYTLTGEGVNYNKLSWFMPVSLFKLGNVHITHIWGDLEGVMFCGTVTYIDDNHVKVASGSSSSNMYLGGIYGIK